MSKAKVDFFKADKSMSTRVADFMSKKVWGITLKSRLTREIRGLEDKIANLEKLRGSILDKTDEDGNNTLDLQKKEFEAQSEVKQNELKAQLEAEAKFEFTDNDNRFFKAYKSAKTDKEVKDAIIGWFEEYKLDVKGTTTLDNLADAISGSRRANSKTVIRSNATQFTNDKRTKGDVLGVFYGRLSELMLAVGTLKATAIQEDVREFYAPKKNNK